MLARALSLVLDPPIFDGLNTISNGPQKNSHATIVVTCNFFFHSFKFLCSIRALKYSVEWTWTISNFSTNDIICILGVRDPQTPVLSGPSSSPSRWERERDHTLMYLLFISQWPWLDKLGVYKIDCSAKSTKKLTSRLHISSRILYWTNDMYACKH